MTKSLIFPLALAIAGMSAVAPAHAQVTESELVMRLNRLENEVRQLTGQVEQLQYRNQQLEQLRYLGAPGGRQAGAPLDIGRMSGEAAYPPPRGPVRQIPGALPAPPPRNPSGTGAQQMVMAPSDTPKDEYDLAYGYVLRKDYALAEEGLRAFLKKHPSDRLVADANYWLGESLFQRQRYREAAESFLTVSTKFETAGKAPDSLLRLGQSLAALNEKQAACATLAEIPRKYPKAPANVKQTAEREQKRVGCL